MTEERERIRQQLLAAPRVVAAIVAAVREQVPAYAVLDDGRLGEVRAIAAWASNSRIRTACWWRSPRKRPAPP
ncbi:hypothetical protein [Streptomyces platensis]|uniref:hypothetical protein n=1 Tax=Streptomyces platensis TaxID=58346 RepID=UPI003869D0EA|nr:hypothetical protein OG962_33565 [Streptomyces platensis]